jgi:rubrerythrin
LAAILVSALPDEASISYIKDQLGIFVTLKSGRKEDYEYSRWCFNEENQDQEVNMSKTAGDLKDAFAGESQANRRYLAYARQAEKEGCSQIARLFRAVAAAETVHAQNHLRIMGGVEGTVENLKAAIAGENYEVVSMYPEFIADAEREEQKKAVNSFKWAWEVEKEHELLFKQALETMGGSVGDINIWVCPVCGHTHLGVPPDRCPVCNTPGDRFEKID